MIGDPAGEGAFRELVDRVQRCRRCQTMAGRRRVFGPANGSIEAKVLVVAEAPGRLGGERTGVPLSADQTGRNFTRLLALSGWRREELFVTNAVLCNPQDAAGRNRPPSAVESANCLPHLAATLALLNPLLVLALGQRALAALDRIEPHGLRLREAAGRAHPWHGRLLAPLYHPGPRALIHRSLDRQIEDWRAARAALMRVATDPITKSRPARLPSLGRGAGSDHSASDLPSN